MHINYPSPILNFAPSSITDRRYSKERRHNYYDYYETQNVNSRRFHQSSPSTFNNHNLPNTLPYHDKQWHHKESSRCNNSPYTSWDQSPDTYLNLSYKHTSREDNDKNMKIHQRHLDHTNPSIDSPGSLKNLDGRYPITEDNFEKLALRKRLQIGRLNNFSSFENEQVQNKFRDFEPPFNKLSYYNEDTHLRQKQISPELLSNDSSHYETSHDYYPATINPPLQRTSYEDEFPGSKGYPYRNGRLPKEETFKDNFGATFKLNDDLYYRNSYNNWDNDFIKKLDMNNPETRNNKYHRHQDYIEPNLETLTKMSFARSNVKLPSPNYSDDYPYSDSNYRPKGMMKRIIDTYGFGPHPQKLYSKSERQYQNLSDYDNSRIRKNLISNQGNVNSLEYYEDSENPGGTQFETYNDYKENEGIRDQYPLLTNPKANLSHYEKPPKHYPDERYHKRHNKPYFPYIESSEFETHPHNIYRDKLNYLGEGYHDNSSKYIPEYKLNDPIEDLYFDNYNRFTRNETSLPGDIPIRYKIPDTNRNKIKNKYIHNNAYTIRHKKYNTRDLSPEYLSPSISYSDNIHNHDSRPNNRRFIYSSLNDKENYQSPIDRSDRVPFVKTGTIPYYEKRNYPDSPDHSFGRTMTTHKTPPPPFLYEKKLHHKPRDYYDHYNQQRHPTYKTSAHPGPYRDEYQHPKNLSNKYIAYNNHPQKTQHRRNNTDHYPEGTQQHQGYKITDVINERIKRNHDTRDNFVSRYKVTTLDTSTQTNQNFSPPLKETSSNPTPLNNTEDIKSKQPTNSSEDFKSSLNKPLNNQAHNQYGFRQQVKGNDPPREDRNNISSHNPLGINTSKKVSRSTQTPNENTMQNGYTYADSKTLDESPVNRNQIRAPTHNLSESISSNNSNQGAHKDAIHQENIQRKDELNRQLLDLHQLLEQEKVEVSLGRYNQERMKERILKSEGQLENIQIQLFKALQSKLQYEKRLNFAYTTIEQIQTSQFIRENVLKDEFNKIFNQMKQAVATTQDDRDRAQNNVDSLKSELKYCMEQLGKIAGETNIPNLKNAIQDLLNYEHLKLDYNPTLKMLGRCKNDLEKIKNVNQIITSTDTAQNFNNLNPGKV